MALWHQFRQLTPSGNVSPWGSSGHISTWVFNNQNTTASSEFIWKALGEPTPGTVFRNRVHGVCYKYKGTLPASYTGGYSTKGLQFLFQLAENIFPSSLFAQGYPHSYERAACDSKLHIFSSSDCYGAPGINNWCDETTIVTQGPPTSVVVSPAYMYFGCTGTTQSSAIGSICSATGTAWNETFYHSVGAPQVGEFIKMATYINNITNTTYGPMCLKYEGQLRCTSPSFYNIHLLPAINNAPGSVINPFMRPIWLAMVNGWISQVSGLSDTINGFDWQQLPCTGYWLLSNQQLSSLFDGITYGACCGGEIRIPLDVDPVLTTLPNITYGGNVSVDPTLTLTPATHPPVPPCPPTNPNSPFYQYREEFCYGCKSGGFYTANGGWSNNVSTEHPACRCCPQPVRDPVGYKKPPTDIDY